MESQCPYQRCGGRRARLAMPLTDGHFIDADPRQHQALAVAPPSPVLRRAQVHAQLVQHRLLLVAQRRLRLVHRQLTGQHQRHRRRLLPGFEQQRARVQLLVFQRAA
jgi:hypothetical protein